MYTVIRFVGDADTPLAELEALGQAINAQYPEAFDGIRKNKKSFACGICNDDAWWKHSAAMVETLEDLADVIQRANAIGLQVQLDTALDPDDREPSASGTRILGIVLLPALMAAAAAAGVVVMTSYYCLSRRESDWDYTEDLDEPGDD